MFFDLVLFLGVAPLPKLYFVVYLLDFFDSF